jgi:AraC family transcriptional regulator, transcriptional activator of pobA
MIRITDFQQISDYIAHANLGVEPRMPDFIIYGFNQVNEDAQISREAYRHHFYEITLDITEGCSFRIDDFQFPLEGNRLSVISPRRLQSIQVYKTYDAGCQGFTVFFSPDFLGRHLHTGNLYRDYSFLRATASPVTYLNGQLLTEFSNLFQLIRYEYEQYGAQSKEILKAYLTAVLEKSRLHYQPSAGPPAFATPEHQLTATFEALCQELFLRHTTVAEYADRLNVSPKHLSETVKKVTGRNALYIINSYRINYAKALLKQTRTLPSEIGYELGFSSNAYFYTFFRKLTGLTPTQFRQM